MKDMTGELRTVTGRTREGQPDLAGDCVILSRRFRFVGWSKPGRIWIKFEEADSRFITRLQRETMRDGAGI